MSAILLNRAHNPIQHVERSRIEVRSMTDPLSATLRPTGHSNISGFQRR